MPIFPIKTQNFLAGESQAENIADKGFSPNSYGINPLNVLGMLYFIPSETDRGGAVLTGNIVASCFDPLLTTNDVARFVDDEGAFYNFDGATLTKVYTSAQTFQLGTSDIIPFNGSTGAIRYYASSQTSIVQLSDSFAILDNGWWSGLQSGHRHPLEVVEGEMFIGDQNTIWYWNGASSGIAFTLPSEVSVTSLRKHPDGKTLLAFCGEQQNFSHTRNGGGKVYFCDPVIRDWTKEVKLETQVEGSILIGGVVYVTYGKNLGYFDGGGLRFLKALQNSATTYSQCLKNFEDKLMFRDGRYVYLYGDFGGGKMFVKVFRTTNTQSVNNVMYAGGNALLAAYSDGAGGGLLKEVDLDSSGVNGVWESNPIDFGEEVKIKRIDLLHSSSDATTRVQYSSVDIAGTANLIEDISYAGATNKTRINCDITTDIFKLKINPLAGTFGFKSIRIYYDPI